MSYQNAYPDTVVVYGVYPIRDPDPANLAPSRNGDLNCVAKRAIEHFEGAVRGYGFSPTRCQKIQKWEDNVHETGATIDDVAKLKGILKWAIILRGIAGEDIYNSGKYGRCNYASILLSTMIMPGPKICIYPTAVKSTSLRVMSGRPSGKLPVTQGKPLAVWLLGGQDRQFTVDQFMLQDDRTYRTQEVRRRLQALCANLGDESLA